MPILEMVLIRIKGNHITLVHDNDKSKPEPGYIRLEQESTDGGKSPGKINCIC